MADQDRAAELRHRTEFLNAFIKELRADGIHVDVVSDDNGAALPYLWPAIHSRCEPCEESGMCAGVFTSMCTC